MGKRYLDPPEWYASLPTVYVSAGALITDVDDRVLLVKPNYRPHWGVPGGILDPGEAPHECAEREIAEELGLEIQVRDLLVMSFLPPQGDRPRPMMHLIFDGGVLRDPSAIRLQVDELDEAAFWTWEEAAAKHSADTAARIPAAHRARKEQRTIYLPAAP